MTDLKLSFDLETLLRLKSEQFKQLTEEGETVADFATAKDYYIHENFSNLFLSFDGSLSDYFFEFEPEQDIDTFIKNCYLTHFFPKTGKVRLIKNLDEPLGDLLPKKRFEIENIPIIEKSKSHAQQGILEDILNHDAVSRMIRTGNFKGQISCCPCGNSCCSSEYLWVEQNLGFASFQIRSMELQLVCLYPFKLA